MSWVQVLIGAVGIVMAQVVALEIHDMLVCRRARRLSQQQRAAARAELEVNARAEQERWQLGDEDARATAARAALEAREASARALEEADAEEALATAARAAADLHEERKRAALEATVAIAITAAIHEQFTHEQEHPVRYDDAQRLLAVEQEARWWLHNAGVTEPTDLAVRVARALAAR